MKYLRKIALAMLASLCIAGTAQAGVLATALIEIQNFVARDSDGNVLDANTDFVVSTFAWTGGADQDIALDAAVDSDSIPNSTTGIDFPVICVGDCPQIAEDAFPVLSGAPSANYATADQFEDGAPIANVGSLATPATVGNGAYVGIASGEHAGTANSNNALEAIWQFQLAKPEEGVTLELDARAYVEAFVSARELFPGKASANTGFEITLTDLTLGGIVVFSAKPAVVNQTASANANDFAFDIQQTGIHTAGVATAGPISLTTPPLNNTSLYQLSMRINVNTDAAKIDLPLEVVGCRLTGGGVTSSTLDTGEVVYVWDGSMWEASTPEDENRYQIGGQSGANTALPPQPAGEWQHHQQSGPFGSFSFHAGTHSAPAGTEVIEIRCSDPGGCAPSGNPPSPNKQLDFDCIGTFSNIGKGNKAPNWMIADATATAEGNGNRGFDGTFHYCEVNVDDNGEGPDYAEPNSADCPAEGFGEKSSTPLANCDCPDFYRVTIYNGVDAADVVWLDEDNIDPASLNTTDIIYEVDGYLGRGGNGLQLHSLTGFDRK